MFIDYDYDYYGFGDYRGGYSEPYFDDYYRYEDYYFDYTSPQGARGAHGRTLSVQLQSLQWKQYLIFQLLYFFIFFSYRNKLLFAQHTLFHNKIKSKLKHHNFYKFLIYQDNQNAITNCVPMSVPGGCTFTEVYLYMRYAT